MAIYSQDKNSIFHGPCDVCNIDVAHDSREKKGTLYSPDSYLLLGGERVGYVEHGAAGGAVTWRYLCAKHMAQE